ncbi:hypothetical protein B0H14DRAFT_1093721 [Mycena olivaceomarginata]|nr:hypothetical protein B0H14DRAFT_1093721 [Mycena olivaceomarginata]
MGLNSCSTILVIVAGKIVGNIVCNDCMTCTLCTSETGLAGGLGVVATDERVLFLLASQPLDEIHYGERALGAAGSRASLPEGDPPRLGSRRCRLSLRKLPRLAFRTPDLDSMMPPPQADFHHRKEFCPIPPKQSPLLRPPSFARAAAWFPPLQADFPFCAFSSSLHYFGRKAVFPHIDRAGRRCPWIEG